MKLKEDTDLILWSQLKKGNLEALGSLYDLYIEELFSYGIQFCPDKTMVMDNIHDVFLNLYKYRKNLASTGQVKYYLFRSLKNEIIRSSQKTLPLSAYPYNDELLGDKDSISIEDQIIATEFNNERAYRLSVAINTLSKKQRQGLFLRFTEERDYEDIARIMKVTVQTSRTVVYRAIKTLRKHMKMLLFFLFELIF